MFIQIKGAKENNLKNINVQIPRNKLIVFTGLSGSGKSTLAMETLQRECQRQYMESMGMTMDIGNKPNVDSIVGLSPAISINQHQSNNNPRSTVGTVTEISTYIRVLFARLGARPCPHCSRLITQNYTSNEMAVYSELPDQEPDGSELYERKVPCPHCGKPITELMASHFSFNKPQGACPTCRGIGVVNSPDIHKLFDRSKSIRDFAIYGWDQVYIDRYGASLTKAARHYGFEMDTDAPISSYNELQMDLLMHGVLSPQFAGRFPTIAPPKTVPEGRFEGVATNLMRRYSENNSVGARSKLEKLFTRQECPSCHGIRFRSEVLTVKVEGLNIVEVLSMSLSGMGEWLTSLRTNLSPDALAVVRQVITDLKSRIDRIINVGAGYLTVSQPATSLSAGEWQRVKLASILGSGLTGVLYILDEPTAGLHDRDTGKIIEVLRQLRDLGNTVIIIEHDLNVIKAADHIIDFGPGAGKQGGMIVFTGQVDEIGRCAESITGRYLSTGSHRTNRAKLADNNGNILITNANVNNLKNIDVHIPLGRFVTVTGVSGSGKTSLVFGCLAQACETYFQNAKKKGRPTYSGMEYLQDVVLINQQSIGRSSRSNCATYTDIFTDIRDLFALLPATKTGGLTARDFSTNVPGGRCEKCQGTGKISVPMHFLPDIEIICPVCQGKRFQPHVLNIKYRSKSISDILDLNIDEAYDLFHGEANILSKLQLLRDVGLGYLGLGQSTTTFSGGEAQRIKLARELSLNSSGRVLYLFDEPTTGLHPHDIKKLVDLLGRLVKSGNSVVVIEHNPDVIMESDWVIDLGPEGGIDGGEVVVEGTPADIIKEPRSSTGRVLSEIYS